MPNQVQEKPASYASQQVSRISDGDYKKIKVATDLGETKWLNISDSQLEAINKILNV